MFPIIMMSNVVGMLGVQKTTLHIHSLFKPLRKSRMTIGFV